MGRTTLKNQAERTEIAHQIFRQSVGLPCDLGLLQRKGIEVTEKCKRLIREKYNVSSRISEIDILEIYEDNKSSSFWK